MLPNTHSHTHPYPAPHIHTHSTDIKYNYTDYTDDNIALAAEQWAMLNMSYVCPLYLFLQNDNTKKNKKTWVISVNSVEILYYNQQSNTSEHLVSVLTWTRPCVVLISSRSCLHLQ